MNVDSTWITSAVLLSMLAQGMTLGFTSILLNALQAPDSDIKVDLNTASTIASIGGIGTAAAFIVSSFFMEIFGRRSAYRLAVLPSILSWLLYYNANSVPLLIAGRFFGGFSGGTSISLGTVVIAEYTSPKNRGMFLNLKTAAFGLGNLTVHMLGYFYHWRTVALIALAPLVTSLLIVFTWPESPFWLAARNKYAQSEKSFYWLRGSSIKSSKEITELLTAQREKMTNDDTSVSYCDKLIAFLKKFTKRDFVKPLVIAIFSVLVLETSGRHIFPAFALQIAEKVVGSKGKSFYYILGMDIMITLSSTLSSFLVKMFKRRMLLFSTGFGSLLFLYIVCGYLYLVNTNVLPSSSTLVPILLFLVYFTLSNLGCTPIPLVLVGEIFPLAHRGTGTCCTGLLLSIFMTVITKITPYLLANINVHGTFTVLGSLMGVSLVVLWFILPETKDKTLQEIETYFKYSEYRSNVKNESEQKMISV